MPSEREKRAKDARAEEHPRDRPGDPTEVHEPKNVRPSTEPTPKHRPPTQETDEEG